MKSSDVFNSKYSKRPHKKGCLLPHTLSSHWEQLKKDTTCAQKKARCEHGALGDSSNGAVRFEIKETTRPPVKEVRFKVYQPQTDDFISSDTPKDRAPMKSFLVVRSQSHTSTDSLRSLSVGLSLLENRWDRLLFIHTVYRRVFTLSTGCFVMLK